jgi:hypothetical protein
MLKSCEAEAWAQNKKICVARMPMTSVARAQEVDETRGFMKAIVDAGTDQILGAAELGLEGGEVMSMLQLAMMGKLPYTSLRDAVFAHARRIPQQPLHAFRFVIEAGRVREHAIARCALAPQEKNSKRTATAKPGQWPLRLRKPKSKARRTATEAAD